MLVALLVAALLTALLAFVPERAGRVQPVLTACWLAVSLLQGMELAGFTLSGGVVAWPGVFTTRPDLALLLPLGLVGATACNPRDLAACIAAALAVTGAPVSACMGAGWVLLALGRAPCHGAERIALLLLAAGCVFPAQAGGLLPGLCAVGTGGLLGLSLSVRVASRGLRAFHMADIAAMIAAMSLWARLPAGTAVADMRWGGVLIVAGCLFYMTASWRALRAPDARRVLTGLAGGTGAIIIMLAGLMLLARADDLPGMASCAERTFLLVAGLLLAGVLAARVLDVMEREAGTLSLLRLGGLGVLMPRLSALFALALLAESGLPPLLGFSVIWMLLRLLASMPHAGGLAGEVPLLLALAVLGVGWAVRMLALVRIVAVMLCGRPRIPRSAGAADPSMREQWGVLGAGLPIMLVSIWPGYWLALMAGSSPQGGAGWSGLAAVALTSPDGGAVLHPARLCLFVALVGAVVAVVRWLACRRPARQVAGWQQGAPVVPPWMVFGDPLTQVGPGNPARMVLDMVVAARARQRFVRDYARGLQLARRFVRACAGRIAGAGYWRRVPGPVALVVACVGALMFIAWQG
ncbi:proton-conducting transporter membrane subunit [Komagataeibacter xylinus]|uniref:proton-conducting transporter transmembrane domain-containing protein n=1 Tax=Komagataeibacter xylinus TaxID=28448 RepID=UPI001F113355|nr:proton-conducting transporter membrane subunit [Komagataeibacter xylinus]